MSVEEKANSILKQARALAPKVESWADFSNAIFGQGNGLIAKTFGTSFERQAFFDSKQYREVNEILLSLMKKFGTREGGKPKKSGKLLVRMPASLHEFLTIEAKSEGVSLNHLVVSKIALPIRDRSQIKREMIIEAFAAVHDGYAPDRVVVDPDLNPMFLDKCRKMGLDASDFKLNHLLYNIRKTKIPGSELPETTKRTEFDDYDNFRFASEIAIRIVQRTRGVTLDRTLCDPMLRHVFDQYALRLVDEQSKLKLRCGALNLRKTHNLKPLEDSEGPIYDLVSAGPIKRIDLSRLPSIEGTYVFYEGTRPIYAGETEHLRKRIELHVNKGLPDWVDFEALSLKYFSETKPNQSERLAWLMSFVNRERPLLNYQAVA